MRRTPSTTVLTAASHVHTFDASIAVGDVMLLVVEQLSSSGAPTTPTGWVLRGSNTHGTRAGYVYTKVRAAGETTVTITRAVAGSGRATVAGIGGARTDPSTWVIGTPKGRAQSPANSSTTTNAPSIQTLQVNTLVVGIFGEATTAAEAAGFVPSTMLNGSPWYYAGQQSTGDLETIFLAYIDKMLPGDTMDIMAMYPNAQASNAWGMLIGFPSVDTADPVVTKLPGKVADGSGGLVSVGLVAYDGAKDVGLAKLEYVHGGTFVPDLDRTSRVWTMGHRGGSLDYQEHSARGYLECAINHVDVLEFSVAVSSDGVMFGLHDDTLNRTSSSLGSTAVRPGDRTWAQIQALVQDLPNRGDTRFTTAPYMSLDDFVSQWATTHTLMFDPKLLTAAQRQALLARIQQIPDYRRRVLGKFYTTGTDRADEFHSIGVKAWGYGYTADVLNGTTARTASSWDYLGLEWDAQASTWDTMLQIAAGKRVIAHIVPTAAAASSAVAKGARALQVSGVRAVSSAY